MRTCDELLAAHLQWSIWGSSERVLQVVTHLPEFGMEALGFTAPLLSLEFRSETIKYPVRPRSVKVWGIGVIDYSHWSSKPFCGRNPGYFGRMLLRHDW